ncbi:MAG: hypothetical protein ACKOTF_10850 [Opitutaceae bacterium]
MQIDLPDALARKAKDAGLLEPRRFASLLQEAIERENAGRELRSALDRIRSQPGEAMTLREIQVEVKAVRGSTRSRREAGR